MHDMSTENGSVSCDSSEKETAPLKKSFAKIVTFVTTLFSIDKYLVDFYLTRLTFYQNVMIMEILDSKFPRYDHFFSTKADYHTYVSLFLSLSALISIMRYAFQHSW